MVHIVRLLLVPRLAKWRSSWRAALGLVVVAVLCAPLPAYAGWNLKRFIALRDEAQELYDAGNYEEALPRYRVIRSMIEEALAADDIPRKQRPAASEGLEVVRYQIGRCLQSTGECAEAYEEFESLANSAESVEISLKSSARLPEATLCEAKAAAQASDFTRAIERLRSTELLLSKSLVLEGVPDEALAMYTDIAGQVRTEMASVRDGLYTSIVQAGYQAAGRNDCGSARAHRTLLDQLSVPGRGQDVASLDQSISSACDAPPPEEVVTAPTDSDTPIGAIVLLGIGGAALIGEGVYGGILVTDKVSQYDETRDNCRATGLDCERMLALEDELNTARIIEIALIGAGAVAVLGGATWWIISAASADEAPSTTAFFAPLQDGALVGLSFELR